MEEDDILEGVWYYSISCEEENVKKSRKKIIIVNILYICRFKIVLSFFIDVERIFLVVKERCF